MYDLAQPGQCGLFLCRWLAAFCQPMLLHWLVHTSHAVSVTAATAVMLLVAQAPVTAGPANGAHATPAAAAVSTPAAAIAAAATAVASSPGGSKQPQSSCSSGRCAAVQRQPGTNPTVAAAVGAGSSTQASPAIRERGCDRGTAARSVVGFPAANCSTATSSTFGSWPVNTHTWFEAICSSGCCTSSSSHSRSLITARQATEELFRHGWGGGSTAGVL